MINPVTMMGSSQEHANLTGEACRADGWYGHVDGLHTIVFQVVNFTGRIHVEASLSTDPTEDDWFPITLASETPYLQFPCNPHKPTGDYDSGGDTSTIGVTFKINAVWLRARLDRTYLSAVLYDNDPKALMALGNVKKITLAR